MCYSALVERDFEKLGERFEADPWPDAFHNFELLQKFEQETDPDEVKRILGLTRKPAGSKFKWLDEDDRIYPNYFAPVMVSDEGRTRIAPMRYRIRPAGSDKEVPSKYNMFNARIESLKKAWNWNRLIGKQHAILPVKQIFERVNNQVIGIAPADRKTLNLAAIFDEWISAAGEIAFRSFAVITMPAPPDILAIGHHRCPVPLSSEHVADWLTATSTDQALDILGTVKTECFEKI